MRNTSNLVELLESRRLLSASIQMVDGALQITGTERKDAVVLSLKKGDPATLDVSLNSNHFEYALADITRGVTIDTLGGNDRIEVSAKNGPVYLDLVVNGGSGNDTIITGSGNDIVDGGTGNDTVTAGDGDDYLTGDSGNDKLVGGADNDTIVAGDGKDKLTGGDGDDNLDGGVGKDAIQAGEGANSIAVDDSNPNETKDATNPQNRDYRVTSLENAPAQLTIVAEGAVPGAHVYRVEQDGTNFAIYYRFGTDPAVYKAVVQILDDGEVDLVSRELSLDEARPAAATAFGQDHPNLGIVSLFQRPHSLFTVRYRDANGDIQSVDTTDLIWGLDDVEQDQDNDGRSDHGGNHDGENKGDNGQPNGDPNQQGGDQQQH